MEKHKTKNHKITQFNNTLLDENNETPETQENNETKSESSRSLYTTPSSSPSLEPTQSSIKIPIIDNQLNKYSRTLDKGTLDKKTTDKVTEKDKEEVPNKLSVKKVNDELTNDLTFDSIILNLKIISKLKPGYKLSVKENNTQENNNLSNVYIDTSYLQYFYRMWSDNSREQTTVFLEHLDTEISKKIEELVCQEETNMFLNSKENILLNLSHNLNLSLVGLNNLINTYNDDEYIISKIEMIINNFELKIRKISSIIKIN